MLTFTHVIPPRAVEPWTTLSLTADERTKTRHQYVADNGEAIYLNLVRGTRLRQGDLLRAEPATAEPETYVQVIAKPEPVLTVTAANGFDLMRAAYHLGNRHTPLELNPNYLRLEPDPVLATMLQQLGVQVVSEIAPFEPESGAYGQHHSASQTHHHHQGHQHHG